MIVKGTVVSVELDVQVAKNGGGTYPGARLSYRDENGALKEKGFHNNVFKFNAGLKTQLANLSPGNVFNMEMEKEGEFWNVKGITLATASAPVADKDVPATGKTTPYTASPKSTYETPEERAKKQLYIIRQSSINQAIEYAKEYGNGVKGDKFVSITDIIKVAKQFEAHVYGNDFDDGSLISMTEDIDGII